MTNEIKPDTNVGNKKVETVRKNKKTNHPVVEHKTLDELEAMHAGTLMNRRKALLKCPETSGLAASQALPNAAIGAKDTPSWKKAYSELKIVLDKREHLPNKQERKALRQARAKNKR